MFIGNKQIRLQTVGSTNNFGTELLKAGKAIEGTVILADEQTAGKGQRGNAWESEPGKNLTCSFILLPGFLSIQENFCLSEIVALGVAETLKEILTDSESLKIKWPNDILFGSKKVAGILIETSTFGGMISSAVVGVGLNVNQEDFQDHPNADSIKNITGKHWDLDLVLEKLSANLEAWYLSLRAGKQKLIREKYTEMLFGRGELRNFRIDGKINEGKIKGVAETGKLRVEFEGSATREFDLKEIEFCFGPG